MNPPEPRLLLLLVLLVMLGVQSQRAMAADSGTPPDAHQLFAEANAKFRSALATKDKASASALYAEAIARWRAILAEHGIRSAKLYADIGNAYLLSGDTGRALANYRRGQRLDTADPAIRAGLEAARKQSGSAGALPESRAEQALAWSAYLPRRTLLWGSAIAWLAGWLLLLARIGGVPIPRRTGPSLVVLGLALASPLATSERLARSIEDGVIIAPKAAAYNGPSDAVYQPTFKDGLPTGTEVRLLERRTGWIHVRLSDGRDTWVPESAVEEI
jgi:hypothetical protein